MSEMLDNFKEKVSQLLNKCDKVMHLKIFVEGSYNLKKMYYAAVDKHNNNLLQNKYLDAGFDLFLPENEDPDEIDKCGDTVRFFGTGWKNKGPVNKVDFKIKCSARMYCDTDKNFNTGYYMYPRSSLSKTKLRLANSVGIIDSGYRGNLIGMFDVVNIEDRPLTDSKSSSVQDPDACAIADYFAKVNDRLIQICAPGLVPIYVEVVETIEDLGNYTERGSGGFGSTGK
jgi:dUTP pyrophosphatase